MTVKDRLRTYIEYIQMSNTEFERSIGASNGYINSIRKSIGVEKLEQIGQNYPILSIQWLLKGEGTMLNSATSSLNRGDSIRAELQKGEPVPYLVTKMGVKYFEMPNGTFLMSVPFVSQKAYAKYVDECIDAQEVAVDEYSFIVDKIGHGRYRAFEIKGHSMDNNSRNSLSNGDIVLTRELKRDLWHDKLHINEYPNWIIVLDNTILCKKIVAQDVEKGIITCHSLNPSPEYGNFELQFDDIRQMYNIIQRVSRMGSPS